MRFVVKLLIVGANYSVGVYVLPTRVLADARHFLPKSGTGQSSVHRYPVMIALL